MMVANTRTIVEALGGQYQDFEFSNFGNNNYTILDFRF
jgi:hypothetical protein